MQNVRDNPSVFKYNAFPPETIFVPPFKDAVVISQG
jgi:hypothetical protein